MALHVLRSKLGRWLTGKRSVDVDENGLLYNKIPEAGRPIQEVEKDGSCLVEALRSPEKIDQAQLFQTAINRMVDKLDSINENLNRQNEQNAELIRHIDALPRLVETLPRALEGQKQVIDELVDQLRSKAQRDQHLAETIAKIPDEAARQSRCLSEMNQKLSVCAETDVRLNENFTRFRDTLARLDGDMLLHTEGIQQMTKTYTESDQTLKQMIHRQNKRMMILVGVAFFVCTLAVSGLIYALFILNRS